MPGGVFSAGVLFGVEAGVALLIAGSRRLGAGEAGAEPTAPPGRGHGDLLPDSGSELDGDIRSPGERSTTGTWAKCSVGIRICIKK